MLKSQPSVPQNMTALGDRGFKEVIKLGSLGYALIHYGRCPYRKKFGHRYVEREDHEKTQEEDGHL